MEREWDDRKKSIANEVEGQYNEGEIDASEGNVQQSSRTYKDSFFRVLFSDKKRLLELFNALEGTDYDETVDLRIETLEKVFYNGLRNDLAFRLPGRYVVLIEHQSTENENMPYRMLQYVTKVFERICSGLSVYERKRMELPYPELIVLYNGEGTMPRETTLRLSDSYPKEELEAHGGEVFLEAKVRVINVNPEAEHEALRRSETLWGYSLLIHKVREHSKEGLSRDEAIRQAIGECIEENVLRDFLRRNGGIAVGYLETEFDLNDALEYERKEGRREVARKLLEEGIDLSVILKTTGVDEAELKEWIRQRDSVEKKCTEGE